MNWQELLAAIGEVIADPASNLTVAVTLMAAVVLMVLILVILAMIVVLSDSSRGRPGRTSGEAPVDAGDPTIDADTRTDRRSGGAAVPRWLGGRGGKWLLVAAVVAILPSLYVGTAQDSYCVSCHAGALLDVESDGAHASVSCVRCHEDSGAFVTNAILRLSDVSAKYGLGSSQYSSVPRTSRCLGCHRNDVAQVSEDQQTGVRISHSEPLEAGWACLDCHASEGHADMGAPVGMTPCLSCHDAVQASAECDTCHAKDTSAASGLAGTRIYGTATITRRDCEGCHSMESCDACHGLRMPHSEEFLRTHPRYSGFDKKELCFEQCHTDGDCGKCHGSWDSHIPSFKEEHKIYPKDSACDTCHDRHEGPICDLCHDFNVQPAQ